MAAAWLAQRDAGFSPAEQADFDRWRLADPAHAAAVARLERTWTTLQQLREFRPESRLHPDADLLARKRPATRILSFPMAAALGGLAAALALAAFGWWARPAAAPAPAADAAAYATTSDGYQRVTLDDKSVLELNANSLARVTYTPAERRVQLVRGEAHFTVAKNKQRPFIVQAGTIAVRAVGTAFNVRIDDGRVAVLVTEGRVKIEPRDGGKASAVPELGAGERLVVSANGAPDWGALKAERVEAEAMTAALSWQGPWLHFDDTPLASVVAQFNRFNHVQIELGDATLAGLPVVGNFRSDNVETFIRLLESDRSLVAERIGGDRIVLRRAP